ncbi:hypothetical protein C8Q72DRAFT_197718 [Fomitopsis betulina]|nr:hypothetical protein C8Q72DRAFT_197718 [Fomitopsis betulina]
MSSTALNDFNLVASVLGIIGVIPLLCVLIKYQLPIAKSKALEDALSETADYLVFVVEEGIMTDDAFVEELGREFDGYQECHAKLKFDAYRDDGYVSQLKGILSGLSYQIYATYRKVRNFRTRISSNAYKNKSKRRMRIRSILPALRRASLGVVNDADEKLEDVADSSTEAQGASQDEADIPHDTPDPPAYCAILVLKQDMQNTLKNCGPTTDAGSTGSTGSTVVDGVQTVQ